MVIAAISAPLAKATPSVARTIHAPGQIVPIPAAIPHQAGDMVDRRIVPDLLWIAKRFPVYITDGYSGRLPDGRHVGCRGCHVRNSDHHNGLAVDIVALRGAGRCDRRWRGVNRLARWAEPRPDRPRSPFRWVGYSGDAGHGCGHHLHLSWEHAAARPFELAAWVEVLPIRRAGGGRRPAPGAGPEPRPEPEAEQEPKPRPSGGISRTQTGGVSPRGG